MNHAAAEYRFEAYCPPCRDPELTPDQVVIALEEAAAPDADGNPPSAVEWTPTYDTQGVWRAIVRGWEMKAANVADRFDFTTDGQTFRRSQVIDHCEAMAGRYRRKLAQSVPTS